MNDLKLIILDNILEFGNKTNEYLKKINNTNEDYIISICRDRFSNGEGKIKINDTIRDKDIYILSDVGNYNITYKMHGFIQHMSPDEHFQDIKRVISALSGYASKITLVMPLLYQSRQHKRKGNESLDCAIALKELETLGVNHIITFDAHDPNTSNAIPNLPFDNFYVAHEILDKLIEKEDIRNLLVISPDMGAMERAKYFAELLGVDVGVYYKRRDLSKVVNGKNPIIEHVYLGSDVKNKNIIVVDDMIASGAYNEGLFTKLYSTNVSYVPDEIKNEIWYEDVDCSLKMASIIDALHKKESLKSLYNGKQEILTKVKKKMG